MQKTRGEFCKRLFVNPVISVNSVVKKMDFVTSEGGREGKRAVSEMATERQRNSATGYTASEMLLLALAVVIILLLVLTTFLPLAGRDAAPGVSPGPGREFPNPALRVL